VRLATWNVASIKARLPRVLEFLAQHRPDVLCLQETKTSAGAFPHLALAEAGYVAAEHSGGQWAGVAVVVPEAAGVSAVARGLPGETAPGECRWIEAESGGLRVASVYVPNGRALGTETFDQKLAFLTSMAERAEALRDGPPLVVMGDVNVAPSDLDVYDPAAFVGSTHVTDEERSLLAAVAERGGLVDAYRALHPDEVGFTWWDYRAGHFHKKLGLCIDVALAAQSLRPRLTACGIDRNYRKGPKPSDHAPLLVDLAD